MMVHSVDHPEIPALEMPERFKMEVVYFMTPSGERGAPKLGAGEYWICREDAVKWLDELVVQVVSPLDARTKAEIELTEEHEAWLSWMVENDIQHVRLG